MKFQSVILLLTSLFFFYSCEKEYSAENGGTPDSGGTTGGTAKYTFDGGTGSCTGAVVSGTYTAGTALAATNTVTLQVNVTTIGTYILSSATVNGISFSGSGAFTTTGVQAITLTGAGTPAAAGTHNLSVGSNGCSISVVVAAGGNTSPAVFTFDGGTGTCTGAILAETFTAGSPLTTLNTATLKVNITTPGSYSIATETVNGISFTGAGSFTTTGAQNLILTGTGTPAAAGNFNYKAGTTGCEFTVTVLAPAPPATFVLSGSPGACTGAVVSGTYQTGSPLLSSNFVTIKVDVSVVGSYTISTNAVNGITFSANGTFTNLGLNDVVLTATGTPTAAGTFTFTPSVSGNGCTFDIVVTQAPVSPAVYSCKINGTLINFTDRAVGDNLDEIFSTPYLYLDGFSGPPNGNTVPEFQIFIEKNDNSAITVGTYNEKGFLTPGYHIEIDYTELQTDGSVIIWNTSSNVISNNPPFTINVTSISGTRVKGTFSGKLKDTFHPSNTTEKTVTEGTFDLPIQ